MKIKLNRITIGIPAYNEEANIKRLLEALVAQKTSGQRKIVQIILISDGSTDKTIFEAKKVFDKRILIVEGKERKGKNARLNEIFRRFDEDILVVLDADVILEGLFVVDSIAKAFRKDSSIGFVAGNSQPLNGKTLIEEAANNFIESLNFIKKQINKGHNVFSVRGPLLGYSYEFARDLSIPNLVPDDRYTYFKCLERKFKFYFESSAKVYFKSPANLKEQVEQCLRYKEDRENLNLVIEKDVLEKAYFIPLKYKISGLLIQLVRNPVAYIVMKYIQFRVLTSPRKRVVNWTAIKSSKALS